MKKTILTVFAMVLLFACTKEEVRPFHLNDNTHQTVRSIDGNWNYSHTLKFDYHYLKVNDLLWSAPDTFVNQLVNISQNNWGNERTNIIWNDKEMQVNFLDTNKRYLIEQYFEKRMIVSENDTLTHFYFR